MFPDANGPNEMGTREYNRAAMIAKWRSCPTTELSGRGKGATLRMSRVVPLPSDLSKPSKGGVAWTEALHSDRNPLLSHDLEMLAARVRTPHGSSMPAWSGRREPQDSEWRSVHN
jgi:hypothetical protein